MRDPSAETVARRTKLMLSRGSGFDLRKHCTVAGFARSAAQIVCLFFFYLRDIHINQEKLASVWLCLYVGGTTGNIIVAANSIVQNDLSIFDAAD